MLNNEILLANFQQFSSDQWYMNLLSIANLKHSCKMTMMRTTLSIHLSIQLKKTITKRFV